MLLSAQEVDVLRFLLPTVACRIFPPALRTKKITIQKFSNSNNRHENSGTPVGPEIIFCSQCKLKLL